jgi:hypothetical protein
MKRAFLLILSAATLITSDGAYADSDLRGTTAFMLLMEPLDHDAVTCGTTPDDILNATKYPIATSLIRLTERVTPPPALLIANVTLVPSFGNCIFDVALTATVSVQAKLPWENTAASHTVDLWHITRVGIAPRTKARDAVMAAIDYVTKKFVIDWASQNK